MHNNEMHRTTHPHCHDGSPLISVLARLEEGVAFHDRRYIVDVLLGDPSVEPVWTRTIWDVLASRLDPLMASARGKAAVRSLQYSARKPVRFGRIGWNPAGHQKWIHADPLNSGQERLFCSVQIWAPSWTVCAREHRPPDTFLWIQNETAIFSKGVSFNPSILLATAEDCAQLREPRMAAVQALSSHVHPLLHVRKPRTWGIPSNGGFTNAIQDLVVTGLFKPGKRHADVATVNILSEPWSEVRAG